jgi:hypothetical protein
MALSWENGFMQGVERVDQELLDAGALVGHLVPEGSMFAFLAAHRQDVFGDGEFEDLLPSGRGRPSIPASVMASILVLQTLHDLSDRETAEGVISQLASRGGRRLKLRYRGTVKNNAWLTRRTAGLNLRNLLGRWAHSHGRSLGPGGPHRLTRPPAALERRRHEAQPGLHRAPRHPVAVRLALPRTDRSSVRLPAKFSRLSSPKGMPQNRPYSAPS